VSDVTIDEQNAASSMTRPTNKRGDHNESWYVPFLGMIEDRNLNLPGRPRSFDAFDEVKHRISVVDCTVRPAALIREG
jgi:hypothetical protein